MVEGKHVGVTGTRNGMSARQADMLAHMLAVCAVKGFRIFHDGDCIGVDIQARGEAKVQGYRTIEHPSTARTRAFSYHGTHRWPADESREPKRPLVRNKDIVNESDLIIGMPGQDHEVRRSGTWSCLRYTGKVGKRTVIIWPDGQIGIYPEGYKSVL